MQISKQYILPSQIGELTRQCGITTKEARRTRRVRGEDEQQGVIFILLNFVTSFENTGRDNLVNEEAIPFRHTRESGYPG